MSPGSLARRSTSLIYEAVTLVEFRREMRDFHDWVIVWDEVPGNAQGNRAATIRTSFARSLSRLSGLAVVMMGTDSTIANVIANQTTRRSDDPWCFILTCLPSANYDVIVKQYFDGKDPLDMPSNTC